jgi:hypothetical protein
VRAKFGVGTSGEHAALGAFGIDVGALLGGGGYPTPGCFFTRV